MKHNRTSQVGASFSLRKTFYLSLSEDSSYTQLRLFDDAKVGVWAALLIRA